MAKISRRELLQLGVMGSAGLMLGVRLIGSTQGAMPASTVSQAAVLHPLIHISEDDGIILFAQNPDMGQGVKTSLPMILAEELDVHLGSVTVKQADWLPGVDLQFSGGSLSVRLNYDALRQAGATARLMLLQAAAERWQLPVDTLATKNGSVTDATGKQAASYAELAAEAALMPVPENVPLNPRLNFTPSASHTRTWIAKQSSLDSHCSAWTSCYPACCLR